ncbi:MAG: hypothetical protein IIU63_03040 [Clostridia bacterium]|nr:hypothetical protein [Clostridia bacterium]
MEERLPVRKRLRKLHFDYNTPGAYFITICTHHKKCTLSRIVGAIQESPAETDSRNVVGAIHESPAETDLRNIVGAIHESPAENVALHVVGATQDSPLQLTEYGKIITGVISHIPDNYSAFVDSYVIMPNHIHLIIVITDTMDARAIRESPLRGRSVISKMVGYIKMNASKEIHKRFGDSTIWQRGFHDHIIRNREDYEQIAKYIYENPIRWQYDCFYTADDEMR